MPEGNAALAELVDQLDDRLAESRHGDDIEIIQDRRGPLRTVAFFLLAAIALIGGGFLLLRPDQTTCEYNRTLCVVEDLDIDLLFVTIPNSELFALLPPLDEVDPDDRLTAGELFEMDLFGGLDPAELITDGELDLLEALGD